MTNLAAACFDALGDRTRRAIFEMVGARAASVAELASALPVSRPAVSQHLKILLEAGLVASQTRGTRHIYRVDPRGVAEMRGYLEKFWGEALQAFAHHIENSEEIARD
jgi:DNA-binding transcriptional ArsR family regulator